jgi:hypothetical protein
MMMQAGSQAVCHMTMHNMCHATAVNAFTKAASAAAATAAAAQTNQSASAS